MKYRPAALLAGSSMLAIAYTMSAHAADTAKAAALSQQVAAAEDESGTEEIVVTARRKAENLQNVPETVNAVPGTQLQQLNLQAFQDISQIVPGLSFTSSNTNQLVSVALRGAGFFPTAAGEQLVAFYLNDAYILNNILQRDIYDIGQIEVERGPQGTLRGEPAPAGSIAETTHRPDLDSFGGYATGTVSQYGNTNINGAVNVPLVQDKLAVRISGLADMNNNGGVDSINNVAKPYQHVYSGRVSVRFEPNDNISGNVMYEHLHEHDAIYSQVFGLGSPGGGTANTAPHYNGGTITPFQNLGVGYLPSTTNQGDDIVTGNLDYRFKGQQLEYVVGWTRLHGNDYPTAIAGDPASANNPVPAGPQDYEQAETVSHELRLSSIEPDRFWDYVVGGYYRREFVHTAAVGNGAYNPGTFGSPLGAPTIATFNPQFIVQDDNANSYDVPAGKNTELAAYAHLTFHLPGNNELAFGGRYLHYKKFSEAELIDFASNYAAANTAAGVPITPAMCAAGGYKYSGSKVAAPGVYGSPYPGVCTIPIAASVAQTFHIANATFNAAIYSVTLSHKFNDDIMAYFNSGSSWRPGGVSIGVQNSVGDPALASLGTNPPEHSYNFEGGLKTTFDDKRGRLNLTYYHQIYNDYVYAGATTSYLGTPIPGLDIVLTYPGFTSHPNAKVDGIEGEGGYQITKELSINGSASWAKSSITGTIPCNPPTGFPNFTPANFPTNTYVFFCPAHGAASLVGKFTASTEVEYRKPITPDIEGFIRGQMTFNGVNPNCNGCSGTVAGSTFVIPAYQISNIFIGIRSPNGAWEGSIFARNVTNTRTLLTNTNTSQITNTSSQLDPIFGNSGYYGVTVTPPREFGLTVTYAFGSR